MRIDCQSTLRQDENISVWPEREEREEMATEKLLLSVEEAADALGLRRSKTYELLLRGELASVKVGRARRIHVDDLRAFTERLRQAASGL